MITISDAWQAGIDAIVADNGLNQNGFENAVQTVLNRNFNNAEADAFVTAVIAEYVRLGLANGYANYRNGVVSDPAAARELFDALQVTIGALPETEPAILSARLIDLRDDRDNINDAIDRCDVLIAAEPAGTVGRLIKDILREGKQQLRQYRERVRDEIHSIIGDPDG